jgi:hypothetical protein
MDPFKRETLLALLALPAGCGFVQVLPPLRTEPLASPANEPKIRPPALGQSWTYQKFNFYNGALLAVEREEVIALEPQIVLRRTDETGQLLAEERDKTWGQILREPTWDFVQNYKDATPLWPQDLTVGSTTFMRTEYRLDKYSFSFWISVQARVKGWEKIRVPLGEFRALHVERLIGLRHLDITRTSTTRWDQLWLVPEIGRWVAREITGFYEILRSGEGREDTFRWELTAWT